MTSILDQLKEKRRVHVQKEFQKNMRLYWDKFYERNGDRFFKDRHWIENELPEISQCKCLLEVGCGVGNLAIPVATRFPDMCVYACDYSSKAVEILKERVKMLLNGSLDAFQCDIAKPSEVKERFADRRNSISICTIVYVLSSINDRSRALSNIAKLMTDGAILFIRDYAKGDLAENRFSQSFHHSNESMIFRYDGTGSHFFTEEEMKILLENAGFIVIKCEIKLREVENKKENKILRRCFIQIKAVKAKVNF